MVGAFKKNPPAQAKTLVEEYYFGLLIHSSGKIQDIYITHDYVTFSFHDKDGVLISANFDKPLNSELSIFKKGDNISVVGKIFNVGENIVVLNHCKLFEYYKEKQEKDSKEGWYQKWWGILILGVIASALVATLFYFL